jgi:hypothetical protein
MEYKNTEPYAKYRNPNILHDKQNALNDEQKKEMSSTVNFLSKLNDEQLLKELQKQVNIKRNNGTANDIHKTIATIKPFLNDAQQQRLNNILEQIK